MFAALAAAESGHKCVILERNGVLGRKLGITGKGRCNVTNARGREAFFESVPANGKFLYSAYSRCTAEDVISFFEQNGVPLKTERGGRVFPVSDRAGDIVAALERSVRKAGISVVRGRAAYLLLENGGCFGAKLENGETIQSSTTLLATGGMSYPKTGSTGDGYVLAKQAGHTIIPPMPSLVPLETTETWCGTCAGLSLRNVTLSLYYKNTCIYKELGEMLLTHFGVSGPLTLRASSHMRRASPADYRLAIDLKPGLSPERLDARLLRDIAENPNRDMSNILRTLLPHKLILPILEQSGIPPDTKGNSLTRPVRQRLCAVLKALPLHIKSFRPMEEAIVTRGGVALGEVDPKTMGSKLCERLFFAGEILDLDAETGGYNLQIAFATGHAAGQAMAGFRG